MICQLLYLTLEKNSNIHFTHKNVIFKYETTRQNNSLRYMCVFTQQGIQKFYEICWPVIFFKKMIYHQIFQQ